MPLVSAESGKYAIRRIAPWFFGGWALILLFRTSFLLLYFPGSDKIETALVISQFFLGLRFDLATLPILIGPMLLLAPFRQYRDELPSPLRRPIDFLQLLAYPWLCLGSWTLLASLLNYDVNTKYLGWEFYAYLNDVTTLFGSVFTANPLLTLLFLSLFPLSLVIGFRNVFLSSPTAIRHDNGGGMARVSQEGGSTAGQVSYWWRIGIEELIICLLLFIAARGGLQENPIRSADAIRTSSSYANTIPLNGIFTVLQDRGDTLDSKIFYNPEDNRRFVQLLLGGSEEFAFPEYPLLRYMPARQPIPPLRKPNIVIIVMESFTAKFLKIAGGDPRFTPNLNRLVDRGLYFSRFYSSGGRSANGLFSMLAGLPDRAGRTILRSAQIQNRFGGLAALLVRRGYQTVFVHGGDLKFDNLNRVLPHLGFQKSLGMRYMESTGRYKKRSLWGYHDEETFDMFLRILDESAGRKKPFLGVMFTLNTHHPYRLPKDRKPFFDVAVPHSQFLNSLHYTDNCLGTFMRRIRKRKYYQDTVFIMVADHANHTDLNFKEDRTIPFLILAPGKVATRVENRTASQLDVLPTVLAIAGGESWYSSMGSDLTAPAGKSEYAFFAAGSNTNVIGWIEGDYLLSVWLEMDYPVLLSMKTLKPVNLRNKRRKEMALNFQRKAQHFHQFARQLERMNRIWPPDSHPIFQNRRDASPGSR